VPPVPGTRNVPEPVPVAPVGVERIEIRHPALPDALDGLEVLHLGDFHCGVGPAGRTFVDRLPDLLRTFEVDLVVFVGDAMERPGDEDRAIAALDACAGAWRSRHGAIGVFGNHDTGELRARAPTEVPGVRWLENASTTIDIGGARLGIIGASDPQDVLGPAVGLAGAGAGFTVVAAHVPTAIYPAASVGAGLQISGHTHGGQIRPSARRVLKTSCDLSTGLATGLLRLDRTLCAITRGCGETVLDLRVNCPPQVAVLTLRRGPLPGDDANAGLQRVLAW